MGSVCEWLKQNTAHAPGSPRPAAGDFPDYVYLPCYLGWGQAIRRPGPYAGFLGQRYDPLFTECAPYKDPGTPAAAPGRPQVVRGEPRLPSSALGEGITLDRLDRRRSLLAQFDGQMRRVDAQPALNQFG